jgi:glycosyltransferase involved in cell wall biosynthesis
MAFLKTNFIYKNYNVIIVDNGSVDKTFDVARELEKRHNEITCLHLSRKGRGAALKEAWSRSEADIVSYMDADLSTGLESIPQLINSIIIDGYDIAVGSRLLSTSKVKRSFMRKVISYIYNISIKNILGLKQPPDAQCGFKALCKRVVDEIVPKIKNQNWFFDTELLVLAEKKGFKIRYIPINWTERLKTKVRIGKAIFEDIAGILRLVIKRDL